MNRRSRNRVKKKTQMKYVPETPIGSPPAATVQPNHTMDDVLDDDVVAALRNAIQKPSKKTSRSRSTKQMETVAETPSREGRIAPPRRARNTIVSNLLGKHRNNAIPPRSSTSTNAIPPRSSTRSTTNTNTIPPRSSNRIKSKNVDNTIPPRSKSKSKSKSTSGKTQTATIPPRSKKSKSKLQSKIKPKKRAPPRIATVSNNNDGSGSEEEWTATPSPRKSLSISTGPIVPVRDGASSRSRKTVALYTFDAQNEDELEFQEGDDVLVLKELDQGWSDGMNLRTKKRGIFPTSYVS